MLLNLLKVVCYRQLVTLLTGMLVAVGPKGEGKMHTRVFGSLNETFRVFYQLAETLGLPPNMWAYETPNRSDDGHDTSRTITIWHVEPNRSGVKNTVRWQIVLERALWMTLIPKKVVITGNVRGTNVRTNFPSGVWTREFEVVTEDGKYRFVPKGADPKKILAAWVKYEHVLREYFHRDRVII